MPGNSPADLGIDRFALLASELHGRLQREFPDEPFVEERTLDVRLACRRAADVQKTPFGAPEWACMFIVGYAWSHNMAKFCAENAESRFCRLVFLLRDATRQLARHPGFTVAALLSLALGIGASAAIFSLLNALLFRPLPVAHPEQLAYVGPASSIASSPAAAAQRAPGAVSSLMLAALRDNPEVAGACGFLPPAATVQYGDDRATARVSALAFTEDCFATLGVRPAVGRLFDRSGSSRQDAKVAVISYDVWQREYHGRADIVGQTLRLEGVLCTIIGVTEPDFAGLVLGFPAQVIYPVAQHVGSPPGTPAGSEPSYVVSAIVRHQPGGSFDSRPPRASRRSVAQAADLTAPVCRQRRGTRSLPRAAPRRRSRDHARRLFTSQSFWHAALRDARHQRARAVVLLPQRRQPDARARHRAAPRNGHPPRDRRDTARTPIRQVTAESIVLVIGGVCAGLLVAYVGASALFYILRANYTWFQPRRHARHARVAPVQRGRGVRRCGIAGLLPAWRISDVCASAALKANGRAICSGGKTRKALVAVQMGLTLMLLTGAFLFVQSLRDLRWTDLGFQPSQVVTAQLVPLPGAGGEAPREQIERQAIIERMRALPGVTDLSLTNTAPLARTPPSPVLLERADADGGVMPVNQVVVNPGYFQTLGIPLLQGVDFRIAGGAGAADVIVSESLARKAFPEGNALGQQLRIATRQKVRTATVIGVAADARIFGPNAAASVGLSPYSWQAREYHQTPLLLVQDGGRAKPHDSDGAPRD